MSCNNSCLLDFDNAPCIPITAQVDTSIEFNVFYPDPIDLSTGTYHLTISKDERGDCPVLQYDEGVNLTVAADTETVDGDELNGYRVSLFIPKDHGLPFREYFGQVRHDLDSERGSIILKIYLQIESSIARL